MKAFNALLGGIFRQASAVKGFDPREAFGLKGNRHLADNPEEYICDRHGITPEELYSSIEKSGLAVLKLAPADMEARRAGVRENWFYVYDRKDMQRFLDRNIGVLEEAGWPAKADQFVLYMTHVTAPAQTAIFDLIHECYGGDPKTGNNSWLRRNSGSVPEAQVKMQRDAAELTRQRYNAMQLNDPAAVGWFRGKAKEGHIGAMIDLSDMCAQGRGCTQDMPEAAYWYRLAALRMGPPAARGNAPDTYARSQPPAFNLSAAQEAEVSTRLAAAMPPQRRAGLQAP